MTALIIFFSGMTLGVIFDKAILSWKDKAEKIGKSVKEELFK